MDVAAREYAWGTGVCSALQTSVGSAFFGWFGIR